MRRARAAEFTLELGTDVPDAHPINIHTRKAADAIREQTGGRADLQVFSNNPARRPERYALPASVWRARVLHPLRRERAVHHHPALVDGKLGTARRARIEKAGFIVMERIWDNGFHQITNSIRPINEPKGLQGPKIRVPVSALWISLLESLGAASAGINFAEVHSSPQTKVVDGQEHPP